MNGISPTRGATARVGTAIALQHRAILRLRRLGVKKRRALGARVILHSGMHSDDRGGDVPARPSREGHSTAKLGVDVGGTFTDLALWDTGRRRLTR